MSTNIATLIAAVITKLGTVEGLKAAYDFAVDVSAGFPFAVVREAGWEGSFSDTARTRRIFRFDVYLYQEVSEEGFNDEKAARVLRELQDEIITAFDSAPTLGGVALLVMPIGGTRPAIEERPTQMMNVIVTIEAHQFVTR